MYVFFASKRGLVLSMCDLLNSAGIDLLALIAPAPRSKDCLYAVAGFCVIDCFVVFGDFIVNVGL